MKLALPEQCSLGLGGRLLFCRESTSCSLDVGTVVRERAAFLCEQRMFLGQGWPRLWTGSECEMGQLSRTFLECGTWNVPNSLFLSTTHVQRSRFALCLCSLCGLGQVILFLRISVSLIMKKSSAQLFPRFFFTLTCCDFKFICH